MTFRAERRQGGDGLLVRRPQWPSESGLGFSGCQVARSRDGPLCGLQGALCGASPDWKTPPDCPESSNGFDPENCIRPGYTSLREG